MDEPWSQWTVLWRGIGAAAANLSSECVIEVAPPASLGEVARVEASLQRPLPARFRRAVLGFSRRVTIRWKLPDGKDPPHEFRGIFAGELGWNLETLLELETSRQEWMRVCFPNPNDPYDVVWHRKFPFFSVGNSDMLAIDDADPGQPVVYLSHDDGEGHGKRLGSDFIDYVTRLSRLGCPGAEDWQWLPFHDSQIDLLNPDGPAAARWRSWFGMSAQERA